MVVAGLLCGCLVPAPRIACGLCPTEIVTNSALASCFLDEYQQLARDTDGAVAVDLSECANDRGIVEPLQMPGMTSQEPDVSVSFMVTQTQLDCLKGKLEEPGLVLDPSATIDLGSCDDRRRPGISRARSAGRTAAARRPRRRPAGSYSAAAPAVDAVGARAPAAATSICSSRRRWQAADKD